MCLLGIRGGGLPGEQGPPSALDKCPHSVPGKRAGDPQLSEHFFGLWSVKSRGGGENGLREMVQVGVRKGKAGLQIHPCPDPRGKSGNRFYSLPWGKPVRMGGEGWEAGNGLRRGQSTCLCQALAQCCAHGSSSVLATPRGQVLPFPTLQAGSRGSESSRTSPKVTE